MPSFLATLDLSYNSIGQTGPVKFTGLSSSLITLDLSNNQIGSNGVVSFIGLPPSLINLDLSNNGIGYYGMPVNFTGLPSFLQLLDLSSNNMGPAGFNFIGLPSFLVTLDLSNNGMEYYYEMPVNFTGLPSSLQSLDLSSNRIGCQWSAQYGLCTSGGASVNFTSLPSSLTNLDLSFNDIGYNSTDSLKGLPPYLKVLNLSTNWLGCQEIQYFSCSDMGDRQYIYCVNGASINFTGLSPSLTHLDLSANLIGYSTDSHHTNPVFCLAGWKEK